MFSKKNMTAAKQYLNGQLFNKGSITSRSPTMEQTFLSENESKARHIYQQTSL
jgi:hypothetical protein